MASSPQDPQLRTAAYALTAAVLLLWWSIGQLRHPSKEHPSVRELRLLGQNDAADAISAAAGDFSGYNAGSSVFAIPLSVLLLVIGLESLASAVFGPLPRPVEGMFFALAGVLAIGSLYAVAAYFYVRGRKMVQSQAEASAVSKRYSVLLPESRMALPFLYT